MGTEIYINQGVHESRIAIVEEGELAEIWVERPEAERMVGDVYKGRVTAVLPSLQAAFVDIGQERTAFLQVRDLVEAENEEEDGGAPERPSVAPVSARSRIWSKRARSCSCRSRRSPSAPKGARITTQLALAGRFVVLMGNGDWVGVSRKISNSNERHRVREVVRKLLPEGFSVIVRTEGRGQQEKDFRRDLKQLQRAYRRLQKKAKRAEAPALVHQELGMTSSVIRDLFTDNVDRLVVDSRELYREIIEYLKSVSPQLRERVELYRDKKPIFDHFKVEKEMEKVTGPGGSHAQGRLLGHRPCGSRHLHRRELGAEQRQTRSGGGYPAHQPGSGQGGGAPAAPAGHRGNHRHRLHRHA